MTSTPCSSTRGCSQAPQHYRMKQHTHTHTFTHTHTHTHTYIHKHTNAATRPPARCLNKNPPTTPDVHHRLSWPPRNILQGCRGNSLGNSLPACHLSDETMIIYVFFIATSGCVCVCVCVRVCVVKGLNDSNAVSGRAVVNNDGGASRWMDGFLRCKVATIK